MTDKAIKRLTEIRDFWFDPDAPGAMVLVSMRHLDAVLREVDRLRAATGSSFDSLAAAEMQGRRLSRPASAAD